MTSKRPTEYFDEELADLLAGKIQNHYEKFESSTFIKVVADHCTGKSLKERVELISDQLYEYLPGDYLKSIGMLTRILGPENKAETGMFSRFYWVMPIAKYVEKYGLNHFSTSMTAIEEITKRNTGEYAIRPFIRKYPDKTVRQMKMWAVSENFHLRRLSSEGLRPKLPWATKLDLFIDDPSPVFEILDLLKEDHIHFVKKSVANHISDYLKVNSDAAEKLILDWEKSGNQHTRWILQYATRS